MQLGWCTGTTPWPASFSAVWPNMHIVDGPGSKIADGPGSQIVDGPGSQMADGPGSQMADGPGSQIGTWPVHWTTSWPMAYSCFGSLPFYHPDHTVVSHLAQAYYRLSHILAQNFLHWLIKLPYMDTFTLTHLLTLRNSYYKMTKWLIRCTVWRLGGQPSSTLHIWTATAK